MRDALFVTSSALYMANRAILELAPARSHDFMKWYFNDLLLVPVTIPLILACSTMLGLRIHGEPPRLWEVAVPVIVWALAFELVGPVFFHRGTADPLDALAYMVGGAVSYGVWRYPRNFDRSSKKAVFAPRILPPTDY